MENHDKPEPFNLDLLVDRVKACPDDAFIVLAFNDGQQLTFRRWGSDLQPYQQKETRSRSFADVLTAFVLRLVRITCVNAQPPHATHVLFTRQNEDEALASLQTARARAVAEVEEAVRRQEELAQKLRQAQAREIEQASRVEVLRARIKEMEEQMSVSGLLKLRESVQDLQTRSQDLTEALENLKSKHARELEEARGSNSDTAYRALVLPPSSFSERMAWFGRLPSYSALDVPEIEVGRAAREKNGDISVVLRATPSDGWFVLRPLPPSSPDSENT